MNHCINIIINHYIIIIIKIMLSFPEAMEAMEDYMEAMDWDTEVSAMVDLATAATDFSENRNKCKFGQDL